MLRLYWLFESVDQQFQFSTPKKLFIIWFVLSYKRFESDVNDHKSLWCVEGWAHGHDRVFGASTRRSISTAHRWASKNWILKRGYVWDSVRIWVGSKLHNFGHRGQILWCSWGRWGLSGRLFSALRTRGTRSLFLVSDIIHVKLFELLKCMKTKNCRM